ncbi:MAG: tRNA lysidine(34) synthetase TilS [Firmicutes bacterium]|nr:tRNA lysidine(34) synthetase TilS [Bacillota bacterium]
MPDLLDKVKRTIFTYKMLPQGVDRVLVAVSGGPDSMVLADLLLRLSREVRLFLCLAHLDHMFRGEESAEDRAFVEAWAKEKGLPCISDAREVSRLRCPGESKQEAARRIRYAFLKEAAARWGAQRIALAHTQTDQAETVLMRLLTGGGSSGLSGIPPVREDEYIRPLIWVSRREVLAYAASHNLPYRIDPSNEKPVYLRNKIRLQLVPLLEAEFNPKVEEALARHAEIMRAEEEYLNQVIDFWLKKNAVCSRKSCRFPLELFQAEPLALKRRIIRAAHFQLTGKVLSFSHVEEALDLLERDESNLQVDLPGATLIKEYRQAVLTAGKRSSQLERKSAEVWQLEVPGELTISSLGLRITATVHQGGLDKLASLRAKEDCPDSTCAFFDLAEIDLPLTVRTRRPGDIFHPFGLGGSKKLKDFFIDEKVSPGRRESIPLVLDRSGIIWVAGLRQGESGRITDKTRQILQLKLEELPQESPYDIIF